jgi:hypothetical protein
MPERLKGHGSEGNGNGSLIDGAWQEFTEDTQNNLFGRKQKRKPKSLGYNRNAALREQQLTFQQSRIIWIWILDSDREFGK